MPGRCTFTATVSPVRSVPLYTWPSDAAAIGRGDSSAYTCIGMQGWSHADPESCKACTRWDGMNGHLNMQARPLRLQAADSTPYGGSADFTYLLPGRPQLGLQHAHSLGIAEGGHFIAQLLQLVHCRRRQDVWPDAQSLPQLDVGRAQRCHNIAQLDCPLHLWQ